MSTTLLQNRMPPRPLRKSNSAGHPPRMSGSSPQLYGSEGEQPYQIHLITLHRPKDGTGLGFTIRGGVEHGLGHFVSAVERGSEAHLQGLRPGDQILAVDGMMLTGATHREVVTLISSRWTLNISVKSTGVIPIKDRVGDPITWHSIGSQQEPLTDLVKQLHSHPSENHVETRVVISITGSQGLGCSICKGPSSKPGIFIQSTKPGGLARQVGLRPGDQILDCNGISFQRLDFSEAVFHLKSSRHLDLLIRKGAGADLFPAESSGYDSSSSSCAGDHHRPRPYRTSVVIDTAKLSKSASDISMTSKPTDVLTNRLRLEERVIEEERQRLEEEQERLKREATKLEAERKRFEEEKRIGSAKAIAKSSPNLNESLESSGGESSSSNGLVSQIQDELQRRAKKISTTSSTAAAPPPPPMPMSSTNTVQRKAVQKEKTLANLKNDKHDALMEEFKRAHRRMFNGSTDEEELDVQQMKEDVEYEIKPAVMAAEREIKASSTLLVASKNEGPVLPIPPPPEIAPSPPKSYTSDDTCSCSNTTSSSNRSNTSSSCEESETTVSYVESEIKADSSSLNQDFGQASSPPLPPERGSSSISPSPASINPPPKATSTWKKKKVPLSSFKPPLARRGGPHYNSAAKPGIPTPDYDSTPERSPRSSRKKRYPNSNLSKYRSTSLSSLIEPAPPTAPSLREATLRRLAPRLSPAKSVPDLTEPSGHQSRGSSIKQSLDPDDLASLDSFAINEPGPRTKPQPPAHYFESQSKKANTLLRSYVPERVAEPTRFEFTPQPCMNKSVRFDVGEEARIAAQDYRAFNASRRMQPPPVRAKGTEKLMQKALVQSKDSLNSVSPRSSPSPNGLASSDDEPRFRRNAPMRKSLGPLSNSIVPEKKPMKRKPQAPPPPPPLPNPNQMFLEHESRI